MVEVEKARGGSVLVRGIGEFAVGDRADVTADEAAYLCDERGDFERVGETDRTDTVPVDDAIEQGVCPWCDDYEGDAVAQHASSAHPDEWADYKED
jgi:hypothetical protein